MYDELFKNINAIDTSWIVKETDYDVKVNDIKGELPSIDGIATNAACNAVDNKIFDVSNPVKKVDYDAKISDIEAKYFTTSDYNKFTNTILDAKIKKLANEYENSGFIKNTNLDGKIKN